MEAKKFLIADDHQLMREAMVQLLLREYKEAQFVMAGSFEEVMNAIENEANLALIFLDLRMPGMRGLDSVSAIVQTAQTEQLASPVLVWTGVEDADMILRLRAAGVKAAVSKGSSSDELLEAVRTVLLASELKREELNAPKKRASSAYSVRKNHDSDAEEQAFFSSGWSLTDSKSEKPMLTERQIQVLRLVHQGKPNKLIARELDLSLGAVKNHMNAMFTRLQTNSRTELLSKTKEWLL